MYTCTLHVHSHVLSSQMSCSCCLFTDCPAREHFEECASECDLTCATLTTPQICPMICVQKCVCDEGFIRSGKNGPCIRVTDCPGKSGRVGAVCIMSWYIYPKFNGSHFGLPSSSSDRMTGLGGNVVWMMMYVHKPYCFSFVYTYSWRFNWADSVGYCQVWRFLTWLWGRLTLTVWDIFQWKIQQQRQRGHWRLDHLAGLSMHGLMSTSATIEDWIESVGEWSNWRWL